MFESIVERNKSLALVSLILLLSLTGSALFLWMAGTGWHDPHGVVVGIIFVLLSVFQAIFGIFWYRTVKKEALGEPVDDAGAKEMANILRSPKKEMGNGSGLQRESGAPLLLNRESASVDVNDVSVQMKVKPMETVTESRA